MTDLYADLKRTGLSPNQATVYLEVFRAGEIKAGAIIRKTAFHRNLVYTALNELLEKKLISTAKVRGIAVYRPLSPTQLLSSLYETETVAKRAVQELSKLSRKETQQIVVYEGVDEIRTHERRMYDLAREGATLRYLGVSPAWYDIMGPEAVKELEEQQNRKKLRLLHIVDSMTQKDSAYERATKGLTAYRKNNLISSNTSCTAIFEDRIAIRSYVGPYSVVEIINPELAKNYRNYFDFLWKQSK